VRACTRQPHTAGDLAEMVGLAPASVSEHLKVLRKTGILVLEVRHRYRFYSASAEALADIAEQLSALAIATEQGGTAGRDPVPLPSQRL